MKKVALLLANGFEEVEVITPIDFLRRAGIEVTVASIGQLNVTGSHGVIIQADCLISQVAQDIDGVILPGGMPGSSNLSESSAVLALVSRMDKDGKLIAAICAAPAVVLASAGFLKNRNFTCYPGFEENVSEGFFSAERVVKDGHFLTSRGPGTAAEFAIAIIEELVGREKASSIKLQTLQHW